MTPDYSLTVERLIPAPIERVFDAWLDPALLSQWMTPGPGMTVPEAVTNPTVGGRFRIVMRSDGPDLPHEGEYRVIDRPNRLVFTWQSEPAGPNSVVTLTFTSVGADQTRVTLTHDGFEREAARDSHRGGWTAILDALARVLQSAA